MTEENKAETLKAEDSKKPAENVFTQEDINRAIQAEQAKSQDKYKDYEDLKAKLVALEAEKLTEQEKLIKEAEEKIKAKFLPSLEEHKSALEKYLEAELAELSEEKKKLIPDFPLPKKLTWLKEAKAAGLFGEQKMTNSTKIPPGSKPSGDTKVNPDKMSKEEYHAYLQQKYNIKTNYR